MSVQTFISHSQRRQRRWLFFSLMMVWERQKRSSVAISRRHWISPLSWKIQEEKVLQDMKYR